MSAIQQERRKRADYWPREMVRRRQMREFRSERKRLQKELAAKDVTARELAIAEALRVQATKKPSGWRQLLDKVKTIRDRAIKSRPEPQTANIVRAPRLAFWRKEQG